MPLNDTRDQTVQVYIRDVDQIGVRLIAERVNGSGPINPEAPLNGTVDDTFDPPLLQPVPAPGLQPSSTCPDRAQVQAEPAKADWYAQRTVWYEITRDSAGSLFNQSTLVTIDAAGSSFATALQVFEGAAPPANFDRNATSPVLPTNNVACDTSNSAGVPAVASFITKPGKRYFLEAGGSPMLSAGTTLRLSMRVLDVTAPTVTLKVTAPSDPEQVYAYQLSATGDTTAVLATVLATQKGKATRTLRKAAFSVCEAARLKPPSQRGRYCVTADGRLLVHWYAILGKETGNVTVAFRDRAGNVGSNSLQTQIRDLVPPTLKSASARWSRRGRLIVSASCSGGPGGFQIQIARNGAPKTVARTKSSSKTMKFSRAFRISRSNLFVHVICSDKSGNKADGWLFRAF